jgi:regulation of enolase protein 1 (concanavalin A-like superfamily)
MNLFEGCVGRSLTNGLAWLNEPPEWRFDGHGLTIVPEACTDFFRPYGGASQDGAGLLHKEISGDFTVRTHIKADLAGFGDAGALTVRAGAEQWIKLCVERSPIGEVSIVSVVTNTWSDDANNELLDQPACDLRLTRKGDVFGMHYSLDGATWRFVRTFGFALPDTVMVGVHAQAPFQGGCRVTFCGLHVTSEAVQDFRSGE